MKRKLKIKICTVCRIDFIPNGNNQKCCINCKKQYKKNKNKKYQEENFEKEKKRHKKWRKENSEKEKGRHKKYREENPKEVKESNKKYKEKNLEKIKENSRKYYKENSKKILENTKKRKEKNPEKIKEQGKKYREENSEKIKLKNKKYQEESREKINKYAKEYQKKRRNADSRFKLKCNISSLIGCRLKKRLLSKNRKATWDFLPYTVDELKKHLENLFEPWMNWDNWGRGKGHWQIDHVKPDSLFNYKSVDDKEFQECWALNNLQPMDAIENARKGNKSLL